MAVPSARVHQWRGAAAVTLTAGDLEATFLPDVGMVGGALRWRGHDLVAMPGGPRAAGQGHTNGLPLLHPWANRIAARRYEAAGVTVDLRRLALHTDPNGLPIHGTMVGRAGWEVAAIDVSRRRARLVARFDYGAHADLMAAFPFPHVVEIEATVDPRQLTVTTAIHASAGPVPVAFGWHDYFRLPARRASWNLRIPPGEHLVLDRKMIPTGRGAPQPDEDAPIRSRTFDDSYALGPDRRFTLTGGGVRVDVEFDDGYPFGQIWIPPGRTFACIEPMTAPTNALRTHSYALATPDAPYRATYAITPRSV
jgi:galactose mutarotase-like enzyme